MSVKISIIIPTKNEGKYIGATLAQFEGLLEKHQNGLAVTTKNWWPEKTAIFFTGCIMLVKYLICTRFVFTIRRAGFGHTATLAPALFM